MEEQPLTYPSEKLVQTVRFSVTVWDGMMTKVVHSIQLTRQSQLPSRTELIYWITSSGYSLHNLELVNCIVRIFTGISIPWRCQAKKQVND